MLILAVLRENWLRMGQSMMMFITPVLRCLLFGMEDKASDTFEVVGVYIQRR